MSAPNPGPETTEPARRRARKAAPVSGAWLSGLSEGLSPRSIGLLGFAMVFAAGGHLAAGWGASSIRMPQHVEPIKMEIYKPPPPPEPEPLPEPEPEPEPEKPKPKPKPKLIKDPPPPPPPSNSEPPPDAPQEPVPIVTGISMASTVKSSGGPSVRVGNTTYGDPDKEKFVKAKDVKAYSGGKPPKKFVPVRQANVSVAPRIKKRYTPAYPRAIKQDGVEGVVIMRVQITDEGKTRGATLVKGLHPALDKLSLQAMKRFQWFPAEVNGEKVDTTITYRMTWTLFD